MDKQYYRFEVDGKPYLYVHGASRLQEARAFQAATGMPYGQLMQKLGELDAEAFAGMYWLAAQRAGERISWADLDVNIDEIMMTSQEWDAPEGGRRIVRDSNGDIVKLIAEDGTESVPEPPNPTSSSMTSSDASVPSG